MSTHALPADLRAWVLGEADGIVSLSVEQHVQHCSQCQRTVAVSVSHVPSDEVPDLDDVWSSVLDRVEMPHVSLLERLLSRIGLPPAEAMLVSAAPALRGPWLCAVALAVSFAVGGTVSAHTGSSGVFLLLAPLVPVVGVAVAFGPDAGAVLEQESAAPYPLVRLILLRTAAVLLAALPVVVVGQLLFPRHVAWSWLLPALGFTATVLGLSPWFGPWRPALAVSAAWVLATSTAARFATVSAVLAPHFLLLYAVLMLVGPVVLVARARRLGTIGRISS
ncbi:hypothetical protein [Terrabacter sp. 2RAF25]|uniref:hypothetical protein n=1 Tax=Terrabacter sp. 2RAF25 TaxID=3232998 RepID=UPI003F9C4B52